MDEDDRPLADPHGESGEYEATFTLLQPGQAAEKAKGSGMVRIWAHVFVEESGDKRSAERSTDELGFVNEVYEYVPATHHMARTMLNNDFAATDLAVLALKVAASSGSEDVR